MVEVAAAKAQLNRLARFHGFEESRDELLRIAMRDAKSATELQRIITEFVDSLRPNDSGFVACPTPAELADALKCVNAAAQFAKPIACCPNCDGTGWAPGKDRHGNDAVRRCPCTRKPGNGTSGGKDAAAGRDE